VGSGPQEIAFVTAAPGQIRYGFVTNSSGSSVSVFNGQHQVVATIPIPFDPLSPFPTAFPFGLAVAPDQSRVYVGTLDGSGVVHVIDVERLDLLPAAALRFGARHGFGRLAFAGETLVVTATRFKSNFAGSTAKVIFVNPRRPIDAVTIPLGSSSNGQIFPSPQDVGVLCDETVFVAGFDLGAQVFVLDAGTRSLVGAIPTHTGEPLGKFQALGVHADRLVAVADLWTGEIAFLDGMQRRHLSTLDSATLPDSFSQLNELAFAPAGDRLIVPALASDSLMVLDLP
jgi:DNA-binding beta-propeller fold protein YncE